MVVLSFLAGCAQSTPTAAPTKPSAPAGTAVPAIAPTTLPVAGATSLPAAATKLVAPTPTSAPAAKIKRGGIVRVGLQGDMTTMDPQINEDWDFHLARLPNRVAEIIGVWSRGLIKYLAVLSLAQVF
jgi:hypothetical protein